MKKIFSLIFIVMLLLSFAIPSFAAISPYGSHSIVPQPLLKSEMNVINDYSTGVYTSYSSITQYCFTSSNLSGGWAGTNDSTGSTVYNIYVSPIGFNFQRYIYTPIVTPGYTQSDTIYPAQAITYWTSVSSISSSPFPHSVNNNTYSNTYTNYLSNESFIIDSVIANPNTTTYTIYYGSVSGERDPNYGLIDGFQFESYNNAALDVTYCGSMVYSYNNEVQSIDVNTTVHYEPGTKVKVSPTGILDTTYWDEYIYTGYIYVSTVSDTALTYLRSYIAYDATEPQTLDIVSGEVNTYTGDSLTSDPLIRIRDSLSFLSYADGPSTSGTLNVNIEENGSYTYDVSDYSRIQIAVDVPTTPIINPDDPITPGQVLYIEVNGFYDVTQYNYVDVDVPTEIIEQQGIMQWLYDAVQGFLTMEIAPGFSIGGVLLFVVGFAIIIWIIKIFLGG